MTVYVDEPIHPFGRMLMCHMTSPDIDELHAMAAQIGVARKWFQDPLTMPKVSMPHYDVAKSMRARAIKLGAREIDRYQMVVVANVAWINHVGGAEVVGARYAARRGDPFAVFRGKDGRPGHGRLAELEQWWAGEQCPAPTAPVQASLL